jgi:hypothetical protein
MYWIQKKAMLVGDGYDVHTQDHFDTFMFFSRSEPRRTDPKIIGLIQAVPCLQIATRAAIAT